MDVRSIEDVESLLHGTPTVRELHSVWAARQPIASSTQNKNARASSDPVRIPWLEDVSLAQKFTSQAIEREEFLLVLDAAREILSGWALAREEDRTKLVRVRMDYAIALTRLGFLREARLELEPCVAPGFRPELGRKLKTDILVLLGDILREEWHYATAKASQLRIAEDALDFYKRALQADPNRLDALVLSASAAFILGDEGSAVRFDAEETARKIVKVTRDLEDSDGPRRATTWSEATARAILGQIDEAARAFERLQSMDEVSTSHLAEARFHAQFLAEALGKPRDLFKAAFPPLQLIVFAGHLPDRPDQPVRFPQESMPQALEDLRAQLKSMKARVGLASACAGADLLFTQALREMQGTLHIVLPWSNQEFRKTSVLPYEPANGPKTWEPLYDLAMQEAATTREIGQVYEPSSDVGWEFMMEVTAGIALHTARALRLDIQPMVLWDRVLGAGAGGTGSFHTFWNHELNAETIVVPPPRLASPGGGKPAPPKIRACQRSILHQEVKSMLFADIVGYSKLTEKAIPEFIGTFLERLGQLTSSSKHAPCNVNTWGDAMYAVFDFARDAGLFALELAQMVQEGEADWLAKGLYWETVEKGEIVKHPLSIRIGLHTGPVVMHYDPVVRRLGFTGAHVNRAARIEPVAEPGQVFASEEFAAMAELSGEIRRRGGEESAIGSDLGFICEYAGSMQLAKGYPGRFRIYRIVQKRAFALECLAKAAHEAYCTEARTRGETPANNPSLRPWDELSEDLREANRAQVADIPNKLRVLRFELAPSHGLKPSEILITDAQMEQMASREHERWMTERQRQGWKYAAIRDNARKLHPLLVSWEHLSEPEKEKDRDTIRNFPKLVEKAGFRVRRIG